MYITSLHIDGYRNLKSQVYAPSKGCNVILGANAQGKTNLLEAIYYCSFGKSHRQNTDDGLICDNAKYAALKCYYLRGELHHDIRVYLCEKQKKIGVDGSGIKKRNELIGKMPVIMFCPDDLNIVKGGPGERRKYIDRGLSQIYPKYFESLSRYYTVLKNRNADLKTGGKSIEAWDEQLSRYGVIINNFRLKYLEDISKMVAGIHRYMVIKEIIALSINPDERLFEEESYMKALYDSRKRDLKFGVTSLGPHKDDLKIQILGKDAKMFGSQGQQRTIALSMKLAELKYMEKMIGDSPILLLDDVMSELDKTRQSRLMSQIEGLQSFITTTHMELAHKGEIYTMRKGSLF
ncbi:MAG: DNA replication/repair protein RecF [Lachnospiraceae bacterium]|nr:DNA replication/repair protein RecF [Lachnospiraceae bacterium]